MIINDLTKGFLLDLHYENYLSCSDWDSLMLNVDKAFLDRKCSFIPKVFEEYSLRNSFCFARCLHDPYTVLNQVPVYLVDRNISGKKVPVYEIGKEYEVEVPEDSEESMITRTERGEYIIYQCVDPLGMYQCNYTRERRTSLTEMHPRIFIWVDKIADCVLDINHRVSHKEFNDMYLALFAKVLIHEMMHALMDCYREVKMSAGDYHFREELMANAATLYLMDHCFDLQDDVKDFIHYFIHHQPMPYNLAFHYQHEYLLSMSIDEWMMAKSPIESYEQKDFDDWKFYVSYEECVSPLVLFRMECRLAYGESYDEFVQLKKKARQGDAEAQSDLGLKYLHFAYSTRDHYAQAVCWFKKAIAGGSASALNRLGNRYYYGQGVAADESKAFQLWEQSAEKGYAGAFGNLGSAYDRGISVDQDYQKAVEYYTKAYELGITKHCYRMGEIYEEGLLGKEDLVLALEWYKKGKDAEEFECEYACERLEDRDGD